jgi:hypothetical protein
MSRISSESPHKNRCALICRESAANIFIRASKDFYKRTLMGADAPHALFKLQLALGAAVS